MSLGPWYFAENPCNPVPKGVSGRAALRKKRSDVKNMGHGDIFHRMQHDSMIHSDDDDDDDDDDAK